MAIVNVNPITAAQPQFGFQPQQFGQQAYGATYGPVEGQTPGQMQPQFGFPPAAAPIPSMQSQMPAYGSPYTGQMPGMVGPATGQSLNTEMAAYATPEEYLRAGTSAQLPDFDPKVPGGGFYPGITPQQPSQQQAAVPELPAGPDLYQTSTGQVTTQQYGPGAQGEGGLSGGLNMRLPGGRTARIASMANDMWRKATRNNSGNARVMPAPWNPIGF